LKVDSQLKQEAKGINFQEKTKTLAPTREKVSPQKNAKKQPYPVTSPALLQSLLNICICEMIRTGTRKKEKHAALWEKQVEMISKRPQNRCLSA